MGRVLPHCPLNSKWRPSRNYREIKAVRKGTGYLTPHKADGLRQVSSLRALSNIQIAYGTYLYLLHHITTKVFNLFHNIYFLSLMTSITFIPELFTIQCIESVP